jgi:hypothetical protein
MERSAMSEFKQYEGQLCALLRYVGPWAVRERRHNKTKGVFGFLPFFGIRQGFNYVSILEVV